MVPALRADAANLLKENFDFVLVFPEFREVLPVVDVHSCQQVCHFHCTGGAAMRQHGGERFGMLEVFGDAMCQRRAIATDSRRRSVCRRGLATLAIFAPE